MAKTTTIKPKESSEDLVAVVATKDGFLSNIGSLIPAGTVFYLPADMVNKGSWWKKHEENPELPEAKPTTITSDDVEDTFSALAKKEANPKGKNWR